MSIEEGYTISSTSNGNYSSSEGGKEEESVVETREESLLKSILHVQFLLQASSSGIKDCKVTSSSNNNTVAKIHVYNSYQLVANKLLSKSISEYFSEVDETTMSILEDEAWSDMEGIIKSMNDEVDAVNMDHQFTLDERPAEQSASANISSDTDSSNNIDCHPRPHSPSGENSNNHTPPQRPNNNTSVARPSKLVVYNEEEVKEQVRHLIEKVQEAFESTNHPNESPHGIATNSPLLQMAACTLMGKISIGTNLLENIAEVLRNVLCVSEGTYQARHGLVSNLRGEVDIIEGFQTFTRSESMSMGSFLASLDEHKSTNEMECMNNVSQMAGAANTAVSVRHVDSNDTNLSTELLKEYSVNDQAYKNFLLILGNVWMGAKVISLWTMGEIFHLLVDEFALTEIAKVLHRLKCGSELDESMSVLDFIESVLFPLSFDEEHEVEALNLLLVIKDVLTNSGNTRVKKELQSTRRDKILHKFSRAQEMNLNGNVVSGGKDYLGSSGNTYDRRRREAINAFFNLTMAKHIERKLPAQLLASRGGYALGSLRLSSSNMTRTCNKFTPEFIFGTPEEDKHTAAALHQVYDTDHEALKALKSCILKEKRKKNDTSFTGEKKIVIYTDKPVQKKAFESLGEFAFG